MTPHDWVTLLSVAVSALLALGPWMFAVHAKLAVVANQVASLCDKVEKLSVSHEERWEMCMEHQARLEMQEAKVADLGDRLREVA
jgi:hypothetical protein